MIADGFKAHLNNYKENLYSQVFDYLHKKNQRVFIVHRLDKDTCGLVVVAKNRRAASLLSPTHEKMVRKYSNHSFSES